MKHGDYLFDTVAYGYDFLVGAYFLGQEKKLRSQAVSLVPHDTEKLVELGCGTGNFLLQVQQQHPKIELYGADFSRNMLKKATKKLDNVTFKLYDITRTGFASNYFDVVALSMTLHEFPPEQSNKVFDEARRILKKNGKLIIFDFNKATDPFLRVHQLIQNAFFEKNVKQFYKLSLPQKLRSLGFKKITRTTLFGESIQLVSGIK